MSASEQDSNRIDVDIDSLPYVDRELEEGDMKATAERLIEQEMRRMKRVERSELPLNIDLFETDEILKKEIERIQKKQPLEALDTQRYVLQGPEDENDLEGWKKAVNNSKAQLESQAGSIFNLELLQKYGANAWRVHNYQLENDLADIKRKTEELRNKIVEINKERKNDQLEAAALLSSLESKWSDLIAENLQTSIARAAFENQAE